MEKLRVWWIPHVAIESTFYLEVNSIAEANMAYNALSYYDHFQFEIGLKNHYSGRSEMQYLGRGGMQYLEGDAWLDFDPHDFDEE